MNPGPVLDVLATRGVRCALIGAHAMAARGYPRFTADVDLLTTDTSVLGPDFWAPLSRSGADVVARRGDQDDPLAGVAHILLADGTDVDVVVGRWPWEADVVTRAEVLPVMGLTVPVARTADLILLKLAAGGYLDRQDVAVLLTIGDTRETVEEVESRIDEVRPAVRALWGELLGGTRDD